MWYVMRCDKTRSLTLKRSNRYFFAPTYNACQDGPVLESFMGICGALYRGNSPADLGGPACDTTHMTGMQAWLVTMHSNGYGNFGLAATEAATARVTIAYNMNITRTIMSEQL